MPDFKKNKSKNSHHHFFIKIGGVLIVLALVALAIADVRIYQKKKELNVQVENLQQKVQDLKNQNNALKEGMVRSNDDAYIEKVAREELDLKLPGEKVFSFVKTPDQPQPAATINSDWRGWVESMWNSFINIFKK